MQKVNRRNIYVQSNDDIIYDNPPEDSIPITNTTENIYNIDQTLGYLPLPRSEILSWDMYLKTIPQYEYIMLKNHNIINQHELIQSLKNDSSLILTSDGSVRDKHASGAWLIATQDGTILVTGHHPITGHVDFLSSYRAESQSCYTVFLILHHLCEYYNTPNKNCLLL